LFAVFELPLGLNDKTMILDKVIVFNEGKEQAVTFALALLVV